MTRRFPNGAKIIRLRDGSKKPVEMGAYKNGKPWQEMSIEEGRNYGIALLDGLLLVDFDREDVLGWQSRLPVTFTTQTRRGKHYYYRIPKGYDGILQVEYKHPAGELKCKGHGVAPGSVVAPDPDKGEVGDFTYEVLEWNGGEIAEAPRWLLEWRRDGSEGIKSDDTTEEKSPKALDNERDQITENRDDFLTAIAGTGRAWGLSERALRGLLAGVAKSGVVKDGTWAGAASQVARIAKSIGSKDAGDQGSGLLSPGGVVFASSIEKIRAPQEWWVHGFFPKGELVMLFGRGGMGKSTLASWLANEVAKAGGRFLLCPSAEEPFWKFMWRCHLGGLVDEERLCAYDKSADLRIPRHVPLLKELIEEHQVGCLFFDSIRQHFERMEGMGRDEKERLCLAPLAKLAQDTGCTIVCNFHENKAGDFSGSTEMENVARCMLHATRRAKGPLVVKASKTNLIDPGYKMTFEGVLVDMVDRTTGEVQMEKLPDGTLQPMKLIVARRGENRLTDTEEMPVGEEPPTI